ncbi:MAG: hypothetical protein ACD_47C00109G0002 [uncultured bacterium]|uniref:ABC-2 type transporter transmembrane domain-containing protein n=1 Tax=Candidatus Wallbacteria bacterium GWC2_49_35 TaxID=1817813 RepID=A0A1F7WTK2_9BACT|nr:MAG: hypothetical protein ACD_47C00109G0002 [uncultured bacterium]OGM05809.1 MAG: hypothetical protein A2008_02970 [Candidatus Wallbacteria bacterium GWC2_49_35]HBC73469.1 hypothetical protein [Candidatus Wallbacteria bacterium]
MEDKITKVKQIADSLSPLIFLDLLFELRKNSTRLIIYFLLSAGAIITLFYMQLSSHASSRDWIFDAMLIITCVISAFMGGSYGAGAIASEKEKKTLTLLRMSGISGFEIIAGKVMSAMIYITTLASPYLILAALIEVFSGFDAARLAGGLFMWLSLTLFYIVSGVFISVLFKKNASASSFLYFFLFALHFLIYLLDDIAGYRDRFGYYVRDGKFFGSFSPIEVWQNFSSSSYHKSYRGASEIDCIIQGVPDYLTITGIYLLISMLITFFTANVFEKYLRWRED